MPLDVVAKSTMYILYMRLLLLCQMELFVLYEVLVSYMCSVVDTATHWISRDVELILHPYIISTCVRCACLRAKERWNIVSYRI